MPVLVLSVHPADQYALRALRAGASGYLTKDLAADELVNAVRLVTRGERYLTPAVANQLANALERPVDECPHEELSDREMAVFRLLAGGHTVTQAADELALSVKTVSTYRARLLRKLNLREEPFQIMDVTLLSAMGLPLDAAREAVLEVAAQCRRHRGRLGILWHNNTLLRSTREQQWYASLIEAVA